MKKMNRSLKMTIIIICFFIGGLFTSLEFDGLLKGLIFAIGQIIGWSLFAINFYLDHRKRQRSSVVQENKEVPK